MAITRNTSSTALQPQVIKAMDGKKIVQLDDGSVDISNSSFTFALVNDLDDLNELLTSKFREKCGGIIGKTANNFIRKASETIDDDFLAAIENAFRDQQDRTTARAFSLLSLSQTALVNRLAERMSGRKAISLAPTFSQALDAPLFDLCRAFTVSSRTLTGFRARGERAIWEQLALLRQNSTKESDPAILVDDHIFSGVTVSKAAKKLCDAGVKVGEIASLTQVGDCEELSITPMLKFSSGSERCVDKMDLVDQIDFVVGFGGAWVQLPGGGLGRIPYCLPFGDPVARASIPPSSAITFSYEILQANFKFVKTLESSFPGGKLLLRDCEPAFAEYCRIVRGEKADTPLSQVIESAMSELSGRRQQSAGYREVPTWVETYSSEALPRALIFLDVNGTILEPGQSEPDSLLKAELKSSVARIQENGVQVGLCSDSPVPALRKLASEYGMSGPMVGELGGAIGFQSFTAITRPFFNPEQMKEEIRRIARTYEFIEQPEMVAVEFGGTCNDLPDRWFSFGAGRVASLSVFGAPDFIRLLEEIRVPNNFSLVCNANAGAYGFASIVPCSEPLLAKGAILQEFGRIGIDTTMIGDSEADIIPLSPLTRSILIGFQKQAADASNYVQVGTPGLAGALRAMNESLEKILRDRRNNGE